jgi:D-erythro-7,8-dihydroneopterin triphosphate epimerase
VDSISIKNLRLRTHIGASEGERSRPQFVAVSVEIEADLGRPRETDQLADTIDYHSAVRRITRLVEASNVNLLEHLGDKIATEIAQMDGVLGVTVEVQKELLPISERVGAIVVKVVKP